MTAQVAESRYPDLPGWDKRNRELVYAMVDAGWKGRRTGKGHWLGKAPDGHTTITVPSKDNGGRGLINAKHQFLRWVKQHSTPEIQELWDTAVQTDDPLLKDILAESITKKQAEQIAAEQSQREYDEAVQHVKKAIEEGTIVIEPLIRPWLARRNAKQGGGIRYESEAVLERVWPDGTVDYACFAQGCPYTADKPRSVANHYGAAHTAKGETEPAGEGPHHIDPTYTEPVTTRDYRPTERMVDTLMGVLDDILNETADMRETAIRLLTWMHDRPDIEHTERTLVPLNDRQILDRIRMLVGQPDQSEEIAALRSENMDLANEVTRLKEERAALRDLLTEGE